MQHTNEGTNNISQMTEQKGREESCTRRYLRVQCAPLIPLLLSACPGQRNTEETRIVGEGIEAGDHAGIVDTGRLGADPWLG